MKVGGIVFYTKKGGRKDEKYQMDVIWNYLLLVTFLIRCMLEDVLYTDFIGIFGAIIVIYGMCKNEKQ